MFLQDDADSSVENSRRFGRTDQEYSLSWDAQYSILPWLLEDLHKQSPHCRLYARYPSSQHTQPQLGNLFNSSCLSFLDIQSTCLSYADLYVIQNAAASCPNLESLAITSERADPDTLPALADKYASQTKPMKLKSFEIDGCGLAEDWHGKPRSALRLQKQVLMPCSAFWESCLDWPSLERLSLSNSWILHSQPISAQLSNLKSLRLWRLDHTIEKSVLKVLESLSNLEQLDYNGRIDQIISRHGLFKHLGKTLTSLRLHQDGHRDDDPNEDFDKRYTLTSDDLRCISGTCPRLRAFGFDMMSFNKHSSVSVPETDPTRPFNSPEKMLECVAHLFWFLEHIEFNLEIKYQERRHGRWKSPTLQLAEMLWEMLRHGIRESRIQKGHEITEPRLRFLDVVAGSFFPISDQDNLRPLRRWEAQEQQRFQVNLAERNDEATRDVAKVRCVELEALKARIGTDASTRNWYQNALMDAVVDRATKGPTGKRQEHIVMDRELMRSSPFWDQHDEQRFYFR